MISYCERVLVIVQVM